MRRRKVPRRPRSRRNFPLLVALLLVVLVVAVPALSFTTATLDRGSSIGVVDDPSGILGLEPVDTVEYGTPPKQLVRVTNNFDQPALVTVALASDAQRVASISDGGAQSNRVSFTLQPGEFRDITILVDNNANLVGNTLQYTITAEVPGVTAEADRKTTVTGQVVITEPGVVFVSESRNIGFLYRDSVVGTTLGSFNTFGPNEGNFDGDMWLEAPVVRNGNLGIVDPSGDASGLGVRNVRLDSRLGVGDRDQDGISEIYYATDTNQLSRWEDRSNSLVRDNNGNPVSAHSIAGVARLTTPQRADSPYQIAFTSASGNLCYLDQTLTCYNLYASSPETPDSLGTPYDFDNDGYAEIPYVSGGRILIADISDLRLSTPSPVTYAAYAGSLATYDIVGDSRPEILFVNKNDANTIWYMSLRHTGNGQYDATYGPVLIDGQPVYTDGTHGVA